MSSSKSVKLFRYVNLLNYVSNEHPAIMLHLGGQSAHLNYLAHMTRYINNTVKDKHSSYIANRKKKSDNKRPCDRSFSASIWRSLFQLTLISFQTVPCVVQTSVQGVRETGVQESYFLSKQTRVHANFTLSLAIKAQRVSSGYSSTFSLSSILDGRGRSTSCRVHFTPENNTVPIVQEAEWAPGSVWMGAEILVYLLHRESIPGPSNA